MLFILHVYYVNVIYFFPEHAMLMAL